MEARVCSLMHPHNKPYSESILQYKAKPFVLSIDLSQSRTILHTGPSGFRKDFLPVLILINDVWPGFYLTSLTICLK